MKRIFVGIVFFFVIGYAFAGNAARSTPNPTDMGRAYADQDNFEEAVKWFKEAIRLDPNNGSKYADLGWLYLHLKNYEEAEINLKKAIDLDPGDQHNYTGLGLAYKGLNNYKEAISAFKEGISLDPRNGLNYSALGSLYQEQNNYDEALRWYNEAVRVDPKNVEGYERIGRIYQYMRNYKEATKWFKEAIRVNPDSKYGYEGMGRVYVGLKRYGEAKEWFDEAVKRKEPFNYACPYQGLGTVYRKLGKPKDAEDAFLKVPKEEPYNFRGYYDLADYYYETGRLTEARENIEKAISFSKQDNEKKKVLALKGFILIAQQDYEAAEELFKGMVRQYGENPASFSGLGHIYNARKDYRSAAVNLQEATRDKGGPWFNISIIGLGWVNANEGKHKDAIRYYQQVLKEEPLNTLALLGMGNAYNWLKDYDQAERYFRRVLEIDKDNEYALAELGTVYLNKGNSKKSEELLEKSLKINNKTYSCPYEGLGLVYLKEGKTKEAEESFKKAIQINPDIEYRKYNGLAKIYIKQGKLKEARDLLNKSIQNYPFDNEARELLGQMTSPQTSAEMNDMYAKSMEGYREWMDLEENIFRMLVFKPSSFQLNKGTNLKLILDDQFGRKWIFKPADRDQAGNLVAVYRLYSLFGLVTPETHIKTLNINGKETSGSVQLFVDSLGTLVDRNTRPDDLTEKAANYLLRTHVLTWICADYDATPSNFLITAIKEEKVDTLERIDHDAAFQLLGKDELTTESQQRNSYVSYYDRLWKAYLSGEIKLDLAGNLEFIKFVHGFPVNYFKEVITCVYRDNKNVIEEVIVRKQRLFPDFKRFYKDLEGKVNRRIDFKESVDLSKIEDQCASLRKKYFEKIKGLPGKQDILLGKKVDQPIIKAAVAFDAAEIMRSFRIYSFLHDKPGYVSPYGKDKTIDQICDEEIRKLKSLYAASNDQNEKLALEHYKKEIERFKSDKIAIDANRQAMHVIISN